ncbi:NAD(P)-dependent oxidoreductase [Actinoplanes sp. TFC3]|uniref:NAD(P)-dependent oxidoreductase n=1 Tax=Actinoplanes sp. TFC3 TaxID=1710355 RepID=UPI0008374911|nr:NAD(P)H-binding protein [Actinoplanes sp. TFC3]
MQITVLAASGATGLELTREALRRGHTVAAVARTPERITVPDSPRLIRVAADVRDRGAIAEALDAQEVVLSGLGNVRGAAPGVLTAGARAVIAAKPQRIIWLGAFGTGPSAAAAGAVTRLLLKMLGDEVADKVAADRAVLDAGGTVFHAGPLFNGPLSSTVHTVGLAAAPKRLIPARISRASVAAAMLTEAEEPAFAGAVAVPVNQLPYLS